LKILDLIHFVNSRVPFDYYPNSFPLPSEYVPEFCATVKLTGGFPPSDLGTKRPSFQIMVRGGHDANGMVDIPGCEAKAYEIYEALTNIENVTIGNDSVVIIRANNSAPIYIGDDDNGLPIYSMNFTCVVRP